MEVGIILGVPSPEQMNRPHGGCHPLFQHHASRITHHEPRVTTHALRIVVHVHDIVTLFVIHVYKFYTVQRTWSMASHTYDRALGTIDA